MDLRAWCAVLVLAILSLAGCHTTAEHAGPRVAVAPCASLKADPTAVPSAPLVRFKLRDGTAANLYAARPRPCEPERL